MTRPHHRPDTWLHQPANCIIQKPLANGGPSTHGQPLPRCPVAPLPRCPVAPLPRCPVAPLPRCVSAETRHRSVPRSEEHTSELQSLMRISYAVLCLKKKKNKNTH